MVDAPFFLPYVITQSGREAYENVLADVGCNVPVLDSHDRRVIEEVRNRTRTYEGSRPRIPVLLAHNISARSAGTDFAKEITTNRDRETILYMQSRGMSVSLKKKL